MVFGGRECVVGMLSRTMSERTSLSSMTILSERCGALVTGFGGTPGPRAKRLRESCPWLVEPTFKQATRPITHSVTSDASLALDHGSVGFRASRESPACWLYAGIVRTRQDRSEPRVAVEQEVDGRLRTAHGCISRHRRTFRRAPSCDDGRPRAPIRLAPPPWAYRQRAGRPARTAAPRLA